MSSDWLLYNQDKSTSPQLHDSIVVSIPACHAGDRGSIPRRGVLFTLQDQQNKLDNSPLDRVIFWRSQKNISSECFFLALGRGK